jgi:hypothetical protein
VGQTGSVGGIVKWMKEMRDIVAEKGLEVGDMKHTQ